MVILYYIVLTIQCFIIGYLLIYNTLSLVLFFVATFKIRRTIRDGKLSNLDSLYHHPGLSGVSFLLPAYNEENGIIESIESLIDLHYPNFEIIIINDGSTDRTLARVKSHFGFKPVFETKDPLLGTRPIMGLYEMPKEKFKSSALSRVLLINKENGGKADALNAGINLAQHPYVCSMDADSLMDRNALLIGMRVFLDDPKRVVGIGGQVGIANGSQIEEGRVVCVGLPRKAIERFQVVEYARSFNVGRTALSALDSLIVLSGVFSIFRKDLLLRIGGYLTRQMKTEIGLIYCGANDTVCEDMEIVVRLYRYMRDKKINGRVEYLPFPIAWTEVPDRFLDLYKQRNRWYRGLAESLWFHKRMLLNPRFGLTGLFAVPYQFFFELLGPIFELGGYLTLPIFAVLGYLNQTYVILFFLAAVLYGMFLSVLTLFLGIWIQTQYKADHSNYNIFFSTGLKDIILLIFFALFSNIGYRQFLLVAQTKGFIDFLRGKKSWEKFEHKGFRQAA